MRIKVVAVAVVVAVVIVSALPARNKSKGVDVTVPLCTRGCIEAPHAHLGHSCCDCSLHHSVLITLEDDAIVMHWEVDSWQTKRDRALRGMSPTRPFDNRSPFPND